MQEVLDHRNRKGNRDIVHFHYLKGQLCCGPCKDAGRTSRLVYSQNAGNGGTYEYLVCTARQHGECSLPWLRVEQVEGEVLPVVAAEALSPGAIEDIRDAVNKPIANIHDQDRDVKAQLTKQLGSSKRKKSDSSTSRRQAPSPSPRSVSGSRRPRFRRRQLAVTVDRVQFGTDAALEYIDLLSGP